MLGQQDASLSDFEKPLMIHLTTVKLG